jgi:antitoxin ParD1/3/4
MEMGMAEIDKLTVAVSGHQAQLLRDAVDSGEYGTPSEVVREAIGIWQTQRNADRDDIRRLRRLWDEGKASGEPQPVDFEEFRREARRRLSESKANAD